MSPPQRPSAHWPTPPVARFVLGPLALLTTAGLLSAGMQVSSSLREGVLFVAAALLGAAALGLVYLPRAAPHVLARPTSLVALVLLTPLATFSLQWCLFACFAAYAAYFCLRCLLRPEVRAVVTGPSRLRQLITRTPPPPS